MLESGQHGVRARLLGGLFSWLLRILSATWRVDVDGAEHLELLIKRGEPYLLTSWHGKYIPLLASFRGRSACVFSSLSARGDAIAEICRDFGFECVQIPDRGGDQSLDLMRRALSTRRAGAIALDGPLGPRHAVHRGALQLASELGFSLLPVSADSRRKWVQTDRWDKLEIPKPWARLTVVVGKPLTVPAGLSKADIPQWADRLAGLLEAVDQRATHGASAS